MTDYQLSCDCGAVTIATSGRRLGSGYCHCLECRELLNQPFNAMAVYAPENLTVTKGADHLGVYRHPTRHMTRAYCKECATHLYNTNNADMKLVQRELFRKNNGGVLPADLEPKIHFFYSERVTDIDDNLPKYG